MKMKTFVSALLLSLSLLLGSIGHAQRACSQVFSPVDLSSKILYFMDLLGSGSTTSLRQEDKFVVSQNTVDNALKTLSQTHGSKFQLRDKQIPGRKNVTVTQYAVPITFKGPLRNKLSSKIRFRKYYDAVETTPLNKARPRAAAIVQDRQFVEFKIDHPEFPQVVIKPRMIMLDKDVSLLRQRKGFTENRKEMLTRTLEINPTVPPAVIAHFFEIFAEIYTSGISRLPMFAKTSYVRDSYSLMLQDLQGKSVEIQLTIDREINVRNSETQQVITAYRPEDVVVELKIPLAYAKLSEENMAQVPGLNEIVQLKKDLQENHLLSLYQLGSGKLSTYRRALEQTELLGD